MKEYSKEPRSRNPGSVATEGKVWMVEIFVVVIRNHVSFRHVDMAIHCLFLARLIFCLSIL